MGKKAAKLTTIIFLLCAVSSCSWAPSDEEAVNLVKSYYLYYYEGKEVEARVMIRGKYFKECECYPIEFQITMPGRESFKKVFYFFKNEYGAVDVSEFMPKEKGPF
ncbi:MAG: hypothetical protein HZA14_01185 [Nitrospirae bacterium]|nr:hypothetical protein [Nitrospirota bacterium]